jgi:hypothetical protein
MSRIDKIAPSAFLGAPGACGTSGLVIEGQPQRLRGTICFPWSWDY